MGREEMRVLEWVSYGYRWYLVLDFNIISWIIQGEANWNPVTNECSLGKIHGVEISCWYSRHFESSIRCSRCCQRSRRICSAMILPTSLITYTKASQSYFLLSSERDLIEYLLPSQLSISSNMQPTVRHSRCFQEQSPSTQALLCSPDTMLAIK